MKKAGAAQGKGRQRQGSVNARYAQKKQEGAREQEKAAMAAQMKAMQVGALAVSYWRAAELRHHCHAAHAPAAGH